MNKKDQLTIFGDFKIGDKVWFVDPDLPNTTYPKKIPGIIMKKHIQIFGAERDKSIRLGDKPIVPFDYAKQGFLYHRRKEFPDEIRRSELAKLGLEKEYVMMKSENKSLTDREKKLLDLINDEGFGVGAYVEWYTDGVKGFNEDDINGLLKKGLIHLQNDNDIMNRKIVCPKGKNYYE